MKDYAPIFEAVLPNPNGYNKDTISQNDIVKFEFYDFTGAAYVKTFEGYVEKIENKKEGLFFSGSSYSKALRRRQVTESYTHREISWIVDDLFDKYAPSGFTRNNVTNTGTESEMNTQTSSDGNLTLNAANEKYAQQFRPTQTNVIKIEFEVANNSSGVATITLRAEDTGVPSVYDKLQTMSGVTLADGTNTVYLTRKGLDTGTDYWICIERESGSFDILKNGSVDTGRVAFSNTATESWATVANDDLKFKTYSTTGKILEARRFTSKSWADAMKELADIVSGIDWVFYIDNDKDLHFEPEKFGSISTVYNEANTFERAFNNEGKTIANSVRIYGGEQIVNNSATQYTGNSVQKIFTISPGTPIEIKQVTLGGSVTTAYTADLLKNLITFDSAPGAVTIEIIHDYRTAVIAQAEDPTSIGNYEQRDFVKSDKNIVSDDSAQEIADAFLKIKTEPRTSIKAKVFLNPNLKAGYLLPVKYTDLDINTQTEYLIFSVNHIYGKGKLVTEMSLLDNEVATIPEVLKELKADIEALKTQNTDPDAPVRDLIATTDTLVLQNREATEIVLEERQPGDSFILGHDENGILGRAGDVINHFTDNTEWSGTGVTLSDNTTSTFLWTQSTSLKVDWVATGSAEIDIVSAIGDYSAATGVSTGTPSKGTTGFWLYQVAGATFTSLKVRFYNDGSNYAEYDAYYYTDFAQADLWNYIRFDMDNPSATAGTIDWTATLKVKITFTKSSSTGTIYIDLLSMSESNNISLNTLGYRYVSRTISL